MKRRLRVSAALMTAAPLATLGAHQAAAEPAPAAATVAVVQSTPPQAVLARTAPFELRPVLPVAGYRLTGQFGDSAGPWANGHTGLDFAAPYGSTIRAITEGEVVSVAYDGSFGLKTVIRTPDGAELWFAHQAESFVSPGQTVQPGQAIGSIGMTGNTTGPHLHLEVHEPGPVDPYTWLQEQGVRF